MSHDATDDATRRDRDTTRRRVTVHDAADALGITPDAIRARLRRGTLDGVKVGTSWYVDLPADVTPDTTARHDVARQSRDTTRRDTTPDRDAMVEELRQDKAYLQDALDRALAQLADERERADVLMREALGRIEALSTGPIADAGEDTPQRPVEILRLAVEQEAPSEEGAGDVADETSAPWWRRWWRSLTEGYP